MKLYTDNKVAIALSMNPVFHEINKHIDTSGITSFSSECIKAGDGASG